jgi:hypothetical protein
MVRPGSFDETVMRNRVNADIRARAPENINANNTMASLRGQDITAGSAAARLASEQARSDRQYGLDVAKYGSAERDKAIENQKYGVKQVKENADAFALEDVVGEDGKVTTRPNQEKLKVFRDFGRRKGGWENMDPATREHAQSQLEGVWKINQAFQSAGTKNNWFGDLFGDKQVEPGSTMAKVTGIGDASFMKKLGVKDVGLMNYRPGAQFIHTKHGAIVPIDSVLQNGEATVAFRQMLEEQGDKKNLEAFGRVAKGSSYGKTIR